MEKYIKNVRFILICNYAGSIIPALQSRCTRFRFGPVSELEMRNRLLLIVKEQGIQINTDAIDAILLLCKQSGDMRRMINILQAAACEGKTIDLDTVYEVTAHPRPEDISMLFNTLISDKAPLKSKIESTLLR